MNARTIMKDMNKEVVNRNTTHGHTRKMRRSSEYRSWDNMISRCHNSKNPGYETYGARGITVCDRWRSSFSNFLSDMGRQPEGKYSIDRINPKLGYSPDNCRWATMQTQQNNRTNNVRITVNDETRTLAEWERMRGFPSGLLKNRIRLGFSPHDALKMPYSPRQFKTPREPKN